MQRRRVVDVPGDELVVLGEPGGGDFEPAVDAIAADMHGLAQLAAGARRLGDPGETAALRRIGAQHPLQRRRRPIVRRADQLPIAVVGVDQPVLAIDDRLAGRRGVDRLGLSVYRNTNKNW